MRTEATLQAVGIVASIEPVVVSVGKNGCLELFRG